MNERTRHSILIGFLALISLTLLAAPARGADWFSVQIGGGGFGVGFGSTDWAVYGSSWSNPGWSVDYHVALSGYGEWVWIDGLGQCWRPWVRPDWRPFTNGRWVWTSWGWTWVAYEPWGYFPHHFGNWAMSPFGWVWRPGTVYSAANVVWVSAGSWVGWYPRAPRGWSHSHRGFGAGYAQGRSDGYWSGRHDGYRSGYRDGAADAYWAGWNDARYATYVSWDHLGDDDLGRHAVEAAVVRDGRSHAVPRSAVAAPDRGELARRGVAVPEMAVERRTVRIGGRDVEIARPREASAIVGRNARSTVERALTPEATATLSRRAAPDRDTGFGGRAPSSATSPGRQPPARESGSLRSSAPAAGSQSPARPGTSSHRLGDASRGRAAPTIRPDSATAPQRAPERVVPEQLDRREQRAAPSVTTRERADERRQDARRLAPPSIDERRAPSSRLRGSAPTSAASGRGRVENVTSRGSERGGREAADRHPTERSSTVSRRSAAASRSDGSPSKQRPARQSAGGGDDRRGAKERSGSHRR